MSHRELSLRSPIFVDLCALFAAVMLSFNPCKKGMAFANKRGFPSIVCGDTKSVNGNSYESSLFTQISAACL